MCSEILHKFGALFVNCRISEQLRNSVQRGTLSSVLLYICSLLDKPIEVPSVYEINDKKETCVGQV